MSSPVSPSRASRSARRVPSAMKGCPRCSTTCGSDARRSHHPTPLPRPPAATRTRRLIRSEHWSKSICATPPPNECPTMSALSTPTASSHPAMMRAYQSSSYPTFGRSDRPCPGRSGINTRRSVAKRGATCDHDRHELLRPWRSTTGGAAEAQPSSSQWMRTPATSTKFLPAFFVMFLSARADTRY